MLIRAPLLSLCLVSTMASAADVEIEKLPDLPEPVSNNAVALVAGSDGSVLFSLQGISAGRTHSDIHNKTWMLLTGAEQWKSLPPVPSRQGRLAGAAVTAGDAVWLFGGYAVAADGTEISTPEVFLLNKANELRRVSNMPVPVDDMTAYVYLDRYIYLVSGWHDLGNVNLVQVFDTRELSWAQATPYPGEAVFGHAGGMFENQMLICDGVRIQYSGDGSPREFLISDECWLGRVDANDYRHIAWQQLPAHPGPARYRMAATAGADANVVFVGGSANPYNFNGIGYNGLPSEPEAEIFRFDLRAHAWETGWALPRASMDHRGLLYQDGWYYLAGGMLAGQEVTGRVIRFRLLEPD